MNPTQPQLELLKISGMITIILITLLIFKLWT